MLVTFREEQVNQSLNIFESNMQIRKKGVKSFESVRECKKRRDSVTMIKN